MAESFLFRRIINWSFFGSPFYVLECDSGAVYTISVCNSGPGFQNHKPIDSRTLGSEQMWSCGVGIWLLVCRDLWMGVAWVVIKRKTMAGLALGTSSRSGTSLPMVMKVGVHNYLTMTLALGDHWGSTCWAVRDTGLLLFQCGSA